MEVSRLWCGPNCPNLEKKPEKTHTLDFPFSRFQYEVRSGIIQRLQRTTKGPARLRAVAKFRVIAGGRQLIVQSSRRTTGPKLVSLQVSRTLRDIQRPLGGHSVFELSLSDAKLPKSCVTCSLWQRVRARARRLTSCCRGKEYIVSVTA